MGDNIIPHTFREVEYLLAGASFVTGTHKTKRNTTGTQENLNSNTKTPSTYAHTEVNETIVLFMTNYTIQPGNRLDLL